MTITNYNTLNKEDSENRFLSERIIQRVKDKRELNHINEDDIMRLFKDVFAQHKGNTLRARAEAVMLAFRNYIIQQKQKPLTNEMLNKNIQNISTQQTIDINNQKEHDVLQKIIDKNLSLVGFSGQLRLTAKDALVKNTSHVIGTGVSLQVIERVVKENIQAFQQANNIIKKEQEEKKEKEKNVSPPTPVIVKTPIKIEQKKKLTLSEMMINKAREDDIAHPIAKCQQVVSMVSSSSPQTTKQIPIKSKYLVTNSKTNIIEQQQKEETPKNLGTPAVEYLPENYWDKMAGVSDTD